MSSPRKIYTGIGLDPDVIEFLAGLGGQTQRSRSWLVNALIREQARRMTEEHEAQLAMLNQFSQPVIRM